MIKKDRDKENEISIFLKIKSILIFLTQNSTFITAKNNHKMSNLLKNCSCPRCSKIPYSIFKNIDMSNILIREKNNKDIEESFLTANDDDNNDNDWNNSKNEKPTKISIEEEEADLFKFFKKSTIVPIRKIIFMIQFYKIEVKLKYSKDTLFNDKNEPIFVETILAHDSISLQKLYLPENKDFLKEKDLQIVKNYKKFLEVYKIKNEKKETLSFNKDDNPISKSEFAQKEKLQKYFLNMATYNFLLQYLTDCNEKNIANFLYSFQSLKKNYFEIEIEELYKFDKYLDFTSPHFLHFPADFCQKFIEMRPNAKKTNLCTFFVFFMIFFFVIYSCIS